MMPENHKRGVFITGTDTGVGKTVISGAIIRSLISSGINCGLMKPVESDCRPGKTGLIPDDGTYLKLAARSNDAIEIITPFRFKAPLSPYSAVLEGERPAVSFPVIQKAYSRLREKHDFLIVEGVGGLLAPLTKRLDLIDLIKRLKLPTLLVARSGLGTLNHTLLTLRYGKAQGLFFIGVVLNRTSEKADTSEKTNLKILVERTGLPIFGPFPYFKKHGGREARITKSAALLHQNPAFKTWLYRQVKPPVTPR